MSNEIAVTEQQRKPAGSRVFNIFAGLGLIALGGLMFFIYACMRIIADNWLIAFMMMLSMSGLGVLFIGVGLRRIYLGLRG